MIKITLSRKLGELRMSQVELSRITGIRNATINEIYNCLAERISLEHLDLICEALGVESLDEILSYSPNKIPKITRNRSGRDKAT